MLTTGFIPVQFNALMQIWQISIYPEDFQLVHDPLEYIVSCKGKLY